MKVRSYTVLRLATPFKALLQRFALVSLVLTAFALMLLTKLDLVLLERSQTNLRDAVAPILDVASRPIASVREVINNMGDLSALRVENENLAREVAALRHWQTTALNLEAENTALRDLLRMPPDPEVSFITGRVIADQGGAFVRSVLINVGSKAGVTRGQAAQTGDGVIGRVGEVGANSARIILVTDLNSRIPVVVGAERDRAILAGDNTAYPVLHYLGRRAKVEVGERIVTSGQGGLFPPGLPIGIVTAVEDGLVRVLPFMDRDHLEYVTLVDYALPGLLRLDREQGAASD